MNPQEANVSARLSGGRFRALMRLALPLKCRPVSMVVVVVVVVVVVMPFLPGVDSRRLRIRSGALLPGFLKPPLIAGGIHDVCRTTPCQGRRDI